MRKNIVAGNWKMNKTLQEGMELAKGLVSYLHLCKMRQEVIDMGVLPKVEEWKSLNPNLG